jgi:heterodisulfide reductase subunit B
MGIPVFTYEEVAGLVLGFDPWDIGLQMHQVSCEPVLDQIGITYNPEGKFNDIHGNPMGKPEKPEVLKV